MSFYIKDVCEKDFVDVLLLKIDNETMLKHHEDIELYGNKFNFKLIDSEDTTDGGKYQDGSDIYKIVMNGEVNTGIYLKQDFTRWGEYYSGYEYDYEKPYQVIQKQKIVTYWDKK